MPAQTPYDAPEPCHAVTVSGVQAIAIATLPAIPVGFQHTMLDVIDAARRANAVTIKHHSASAWLRHHLPAFPVKLLI